MTLYQVGDIIKNRHHESYFMVVEEKSWGFKIKRISKPRTGYPDTYALDHEYIYTKYELAA